jgi:hypothetical protein
MIFPEDALAYAIANKLDDETTIKPEKLLFFCESENASALDLDAANINDDDIELVNIVYNTHPLVIFCGNYKQALTLNLLQHDFKIKSKSFGYWQQWRMAAALAAVWLVLHLSVTAFQYNQVKAENIVVKNKIEKIYKTAFPKSRKINNPLPAGKILQWSGSRNERHHISIDHI